MSEYDTPPTRLDNLRAYRTEAERAIEACDKLIKEAERSDSPLKDFHKFYIARRQAWATAASRYAASIEKLEAAS